MGFETEEWESTAPAGPVLPMVMPAPVRVVPTTSVHDASPVLPMPPLRTLAAHTTPRASDGRGGQIGRYVVLKEIGAGGMGLVLAAYDPDLERKVALKILRDGLRDGSVGAVRMRREAQAMARLSHPNVAQVYEVAEVGGRLFLAMEFIEGETLRGWLLAAPRSWQEVLRVYLEAGRGLAAAHAAGLMHRDFKPENAMLAADGRVRVLDFGLSRMHAPADAAAGGVGGALELEVTAAGSLLGTPAYMSPEQHLRAEVDARSDQFSFCVALWEALYGERPFAGKSMLELAKNVRLGLIAPPPAKTRVPTWLRKVLERGLTPDPDRRWPTMEALLAALADDPQRRRRRWLAAGAAVLAIGAAGYATAAYRAAEVQVCSAADELRGVWDADRRAAVEQAVRATGVSYAERTVTEVHAQLDAYASQWASIHEAACVAHQRGHVSPQWFDRRMACLRLRRSELEATAAVLAQTTRESVAQAIEAARGLPAVALCEDDGRLLAAVAPPADPAIAAAVETSQARLARLQALERGGRFSEAQSGIDAVVAEADALGYLPHRAEVHLLRGKLSMHLQSIDGRAQLEHALWLALEAQVDVVAAEAAVVRIYQVAAVEHRPLEAQSLVPMAWALVRRIGSPAPLIGLLHNNEGIAWEELGDLPPAIAAYERGLAHVVTHTPRDLLHWVLVNNLAVILNKTGQYERARVLARDALVTLEAEYDPCYLLASMLRGALAGSDAALGDFAAAIAGFEREVACVVDDYPLFAILELDDLAQIHLLRGDAATAVQTLDRAEALARANPGTPVGGIDLVRVDVDLHTGALAQARERLAAASDTDEMMRARLATRRALVAHRDGEHEAALVHLEVAAPTLHRLEQAERGLHAFTRARALRALGRDPAQVTALAEQAIQAYTLAGALYADKLAEVRAWQASRDH